MKTQAIVYHNIETNYLVGVVTVSGKYFVPKDVATICERAKAYGTFSSCIHLPNNTWEVRVEIANRDKVEEFCRIFNCE